MLLSTFSSKSTFLCLQPDASNQASDMEKAMDTMLMGGERDSGSESDGDDGEEDDSDSEEDSEGERDDGGEVDKRMMVDRQEDDREKGREEDRGDRHAGERRSLVRICACLITPSVLGSVFKSVHCLVL